MGQPSLFNPLAALAMVPLVVGCCIAGGVAAMSKPLTALDPLPPLKPLKPKPARPMRQDVTLKPIDDKLWE